MQPTFVEGLGVKEALMQGKGPEREARYRVDVRVDCSTRDFFVANRMTNISRGGLFVEVSFPLHSEVELVFRLPDSDRPILARGKVVWNYDMRKNSARLVVGSGIRFTEITVEDRLVLEAHLERLGSPTALGGPRDHWRPGTTAGEEDFPFARPEPEGRLAS